VEEDCILRSGFAFGVVVFFCVVGGPSREDVMVVDVRWVPGPGAYFEEGARDWPGRARARERERRDILGVDEEAWLFATELRFGVRISDIQSCK
jgi:hypothetical protein